MKSPDNAVRRADHLKHIHQRIKESVQVKQNFTKTLVRNVAIAADKIVDSYRKGGKLILFGNGGSAADAQHIACELVGKFLKERPPLEAIALNSNTSILTCLGNDYGYRHVFERQIEAFAKPCDVVLGISTSGDSANIVSAMRRAKKIGCTTIGMTGQSGGKLKTISNILLNVPSKETPRIQESHILIGHIICELVERAVQEQRA